MEPLEGLLPALCGRVVATGRGTKGQTFARLDNDLYLWAIVIPGEGVDTLRLNFHLFFSSDGSHAIPPFEIVGDLLTVHLGYSMRFPGEFWGDRTVRAELRRLKQVSGWRDLSLVLMRVKKPRPGLASEPRTWAGLGVPVAGWQHGDLVGCDWHSLTHKILGSVDEIGRLLDMLAPRRGASPLHPH